jgi:hypothetical protein
MGRIVRAPDDGTVTTARQGVQPSGITRPSCLRHGTFTHHGQHRAASGASPASTAP